MIWGLLRRLRLPLLVFAALAATGCTSAQLEKDVNAVITILTEAATWESDAVLWLDRTQAAEQAFFAAAPNSAAQAAIESRLNDARALLQAAGQAAAAEGKDLSAGDLANAYAMFVTAAKAIDADMRALVSPVASFAVSPIQPPLPTLPLCVLASEKATK